jgi:uncharacterized membrane protein YccC
LIFWNTLVRFEKAKVIPWIALRNAFGVALPLVLGAAIGRVPAGLIAAIGALNVSYSDGPEPYPQRARRMLVSTCCCALAVAAGGLLGREHLLLILLAGLSAFVAGTMVAVTQTAADIGVMSLATLIVFAAQAMAPEVALQSGLLAFGGGLLQTILAIASWPVSRYAPERRALAAFYTSLAQAAGTGAQALAAPDLPPPASAESTQAQSAVSALAGDGSVEAERIAALLSQAERIRLSILTIARLRVRLAREPDGAAEAAILDDALAAVSRAMAEIAEALTPGGTPAMSEAPSVETSRIEADAERLRASGRAMSRDARWQLDALAGQLRAVAELAFHATAAGSAAFAALEAAAPRRLRLGNVLARLRANLSLESAAFRHALRLGACVAVGESINRVIGSNLPGAPRGYWLPMTVAIVLRPDFTGTFTRGFLRLGGTLAGLIAATAIVHFLAPSPGVEILLIAAFTFLMRCFGPANYGIFVAALTSLVVFLIGITGVAPGPVMVARGVNTLAGGAIALLAYGLWPTWERNLMPERLADLFDAYRAYFGAVCDAYASPGPDAQPRLDRVRLAARLARSNAEASLARLLSEPGVSEERVATLRKLLANSHRFVLAVMALEAGLMRSAPAPVRESFRTFSQGVVTSLQQLADALRDKPVDPAAMPDLRELHGELVRAGDSHFGRHALVNVETDRIVNSLNTLCEQVRRAGHVAVNN